MELGRVGFKTRDVEDLLTLYGVLDDVERRGLLEMVREANTPGWWHKFGEVLPNWFVTSTLRLTFFGSMLASS